MGSGFEWVPRLALRRPVTMLMLLAAVVVLGAVSYFRLPLELMPAGSDPGRIWLRAYYRHAAAADMLVRILEPVEEQLRTLPGLKSIESKASFERGSISLGFHRDANLTQAYLQVHEKLERLRATLPEDFDRFTVLRWDSRSRPMLWARVVSAQTGSGIDELAMERLEQTIGRIAGVAKVEFFGRGGQELAVLLEPGALRSLGVEPGRVVAALLGDNFSIPLGWLEEPIRRSLVRATATLENVAAVRNLPLAAAGASPQGGGPAQGAPGGGLRIGDVGEVRIQEKARANWSKVEGRLAATMAVYKETGANTVAVGRTLDRAIAEDLPRDPLLAGLEVHPLFEEHRVISGALANLQQTALWGGLLAFLVLYLFFRTVVPALLVMAAVPVAVLFTLGWMFVLGGSINILSLVGLMLALGMLVDNAVVVVENTTRLRAAGAPPLEAARRGAGEVGLAIVMGTLTTVIVFLPLPFLGAGAFLTFVFRQVSYPIVLSLFGSLLVAALFIPLVARLLLGRAGLAGEPAWFAPLRRGYGLWLRRMLAHRLDATLLLVLVLGSTALPLAGIKWDLFGSRGRERMWISFEHSPVFTVAETEAYFDRLMARLDARRAALGIRVAMVSYRRGGGTLNLFLNEQGPQPETLQAALREVFGVEPGVSYDFRGAGEGQGARRLTVRLFGPRPAQLRELAGRVRAATRGLPGVGELVLEEERPPREIAVRIDRRRAESNGITARVVAQRVAAALRGTSALPRFRLGEREIEVVVRQKLPPAGLAALANLPLPTNQGPVPPATEPLGTEPLGTEPLGTEPLGTEPLDTGPLGTEPPGRGPPGTVPLNAVARLEFREAPEELTRIGGQLALALEARFEGDDFPAAQRALNRRLAGMTFPQGYGWGRGEQGANLQEDRASLGAVLLLAAVAIFIVMGVLFESVLLPLTVLATIPLALVGSAWTMYLTATPMDTTGMVGMVILAGVVVNNGIVLVDRINRNRGGGMALQEAVVQAGDVRLRPILITALTTIGGLVPMVFGFTNVAGYSFNALGRVVAGGLLAGTLLTLFVVPLAYCLLAPETVVGSATLPPPGAGAGAALIATPRQKG